MAENTKNAVPARQQQQPMTRRETPGMGSPFRMLERFADEIDSVFDNFGIGRGWLLPRTTRSAGTGTDIWVPQVEVTQQGNELVVRADLPGMKKEDIQVDVTDDEITVSGERRREEETEKGGLYRSERSYGFFTRTIRLPEGAMADQAKAAFKDGVLEIRMPTPPEQVTRGRRLEIKEGTETKK
jgi:HSP20 family protein